MATNKHAELMQQLCDKLDRQYEQQSEIAVRLQAIQALFLRVISQVWKKLEL